MPTPVQHARRLAALLAITAAFLQGCPSGSPTPGNPITPIDVTKTDMPADMLSDMPTDMIVDMLPDMPVDMQNEPDLTEEVDEAPDLACEQESTLQFCMRYAYSCGELTAEDNCGEMRTEVCGEMCSLPQTCVPEVNDEEMVLSQSCICNFDNVVEVCDRVGKLCGPLAPPCEGMVCDNFCVDSVASGAKFNCAVGSGNMRCWGENSKGQLGLGNKQAEKNPTPVELELKVTDIAAGGEHACAILDDTSLICWGNNEFGQLGISTTVDQLFPDLVNPNSRAILKGVAKVVLNDRHTCALVDDDFDPVMDAEPVGPYSAYCWGSNKFGAIGNKDIVVLGADAGTPIKVKGLDSKVIDIAAGYSHTCAVVEEGDPNNRTVRCWGADEGGQLGVRDIGSAGIYVLNNLGRRKTGGFNGYYHHYMNNELEGNLIIIETPTTVRTDRPDNQVSDAEFVNDPTQIFSGPIEEVVTGRYSTCARMSTGAVYCWGAFSYKTQNTSCNIAPYWDSFKSQQTYQEENPENPPVTVSVATLQVDRCVTWPLESDWEGPTVAMLGNSSGQDTQYGLPAGFIDFRAISPRPRQLVHHPDDNSIHPPYLTGGETVLAKQISVYNEHACLLLDDDANLPGPGSEPAFSNVYCFGLNEFGQLGNGTNSPQGYPMSLTRDINAQIVRAEEINTGVSHSCAVSTNNNILCWGSNQAGQLGNENLLRDESFRPFDVLLR